MEWFSIIALVVFGLALIVLEVIFIPGTTFVGIAGFIIAGFGIWQSFVSFGTQVGLAVLTITSLAAIGAIVYSFKTGVWKRFALNSSNKSRFNEDLKHNLWEGDQGVTISALRPMGKVEFSDKVYEVKTNGSYIESGTRVKILKIKDQTIIVEPVEKM